MHKFFALAFLCLLALDGFGQEPECSLPATYSTKTNAAGNWNNPASWNGDAVPPYPLFGGLITIPMGHILRIESSNFTLNNASLKVEAGATLIISGKLFLDELRYLEIASGAKLICCNTPNCNPSSKLNIGGEEVWNGNDGTQDGPLIFTEDGVLPVELVSFTGSYEEEGIRLLWKTASEVNFNYFGVERSDDGISFSHIISVAGKGDNHTPAEYSSLDEDINRTGYFYYRLRAVDKDETYEFSKTIVVHAGPKSKDITVWPNPVRNHRLFVSNNSDATGSTFILYDAFGRARTFRSLPAVENQIDLDADLPPGIYIARIVGRNDSKTIRLIIVD